MNSEQINPENVHEVLVKSSEYYQLKKKLTKGIYQPIVRYIDGKIRTGIVVGLSNNLRVLVAVVE
ncbi:hypothetical protein [Methanospirillum lacunae]|jgi:hypothetical protein|uniref:Uncharacterized protein n=1 Tax=Methanospirillum lacunae TaxID=668570 RepID=A0A2V2N3K4_9EURY|nr:hypothetical protein [Methanospirillum lacunae]PWR74369.1 hypothetical protein DK846_04255 [Methanospirillum lacunae]